MTTPEPDPFEVRAAAHRDIAAALRAQAAQHDLAAAALLATRSLEKFKAAMAAADAMDVANHPDLAELDVQLNSRYDAPG